ncbi:S8 family serine peptidase [Roseateles sp. BYS180W]|uniref:S8 family serine peptidase n=1 Tax=Roseateles rivi TaxID=3299028 RepID=A0ABW7FT98_9BURK
MSPALQAQQDLAAKAPSARVIVRFKPQSGTVKAQALAARSTAVTAQQVAQYRALALGQRRGLVLNARRSVDERTHVVVAQGLSSAELMRRLAQDPDVESVEIDHFRRHSMVPNDPFYATALPSGPAAGQWYLKPPTASAANTGTELVSSINAPAAWDKATGAGVVVAVLDTGVRFDHPDLLGQLLSGYDLVAFQNGTVAQANDSNGADADASDPGDWVNDADISGGTLGADCTSSDKTSSSWHGTKVSGLIAALANNGQGIAGLAHGAKILPVRVLGKCGGWDSDIQAGMRWAVGLSVPGLPVNPNPARVLNMSLGGSGACSNGYKSTINEVVAKGAVVVAAAGNGVDSPSPGGGVAANTPANCTPYSSGVVSVAALRHIGTKVGFSNLGSDVTLAAPGGNCVNTAAGSPCLYPMLTTSNSGSTTPVINDNNYTLTEAAVGTSFSTPLVSATAALMLQRNPALTPAELVGYLKGSTRPFPSTGSDAATKACTAPSTATPQLECYCTTSTCGTGMLDAAAAVNAVPLPTAPAPSPAPSPAPAPSPLPASPSGSGGGGGALDMGWALALGLAALSLRPRKPSSPCPAPRD